MNTIKPTLKKIQTTEQLVQAITKTMKRITFNQNVSVRTLQFKEDIPSVKDYVENINEKLQTTEIPVTKSKAINIVPKEEDSLKAVVKALVLEVEVAKPDEVIDTLVEALKLVKEAVEAAVEAAVELEEAEKVLEKARDMGLVTIELPENTMDKVLELKRLKKVVTEAQEKEKKSLEALAQAFKALAQAFKVLAKAFEAERADLIPLFTPTAEADTKEKLEKTFKSLVEASKAKNADIRPFYTPVVEAEVETKKVKIFKELEQALEGNQKSLFISALNALTKEEKVKVLNVLAKSVEDYVERDDYLEEDHSIEEDNCLKEDLEAACSTKASGLVDNEDATEEYEGDFLARYKQDLVEKAKDLKKEEDTSYYFSSLTLDYSNENFSEYDSGEEDDSFPITTVADKSQLKDNDLNLSGDNAIETEYMP